MLARGGGGANNTENILKKESKRQLALRPGEENELEKAKSCMSDRLWR